MSVDEEKITKLFVFLTVDGGKERHVALKKVASAYGKTVREVLVTLRKQGLCLTQEKVSQKIVKQQRDILIRSLVKDHGMAPDEVVSLLQFTITEASVKHIITSKKKNT